MPFPAGSFLGGFRTPATVQAASLHPPASETLNITGLMHRSKQHLYSITSSARTSNEGGTVRPSA
jgi:hypothetical protein